MSKLQTNAKKGRSMFEYQTREDGSGFESFKNEYIKADGADTLYKALSDAIHEFGGDDDFAYDQVTTALDEFAECETREQAEQVIDELEGDAYTSSLTAWLDKHNAHVYYLSEALSEYGANDGFQALSLAQMLAKRELYNAVLEAIA